MNFSTLQDATSSDPATLPVNGVLTCDLLIEAGVLILNAEGSMLRDGAVAIQDGRIVAVGPAAELRNLYEAHEHFIARDDVLMPGLINPHNHSPLMLVRGVIKDIGFAPAYTPGVPQGHMLSAEEVYLLSRLGVYEQMRAGCTTVGEWYWHANSIARAVAESGLRGFVSGRIMDVDTLALGRGEWHYDRAIGEATVRQVDDVIARWHGHDGGRIQCFIGVHAADTSSIDQLREVASMARSTGLPVHTHVNQNEGAVRLIEERDGCRPLDLWERVGLVDSNLVAAHCIFSTDDELARLAKAQASVIHCPYGNGSAGMMASAFAMHRRGIRICLATDTSSADLLESMRFGLVIARLQGAGYDVDARTMLGWCWRNSAAALGIGTEVGAIEVGRKADLAIIDGKAPNLAPGVDPVGQMVWSAQGNNVRHVLVDGDFVLRDGRPTRFDGDEVVAAASRVAKRLWRDVAGRH